MIIFYALRKKGNNMEDNFYEFRKIKTSNGEEYAVDVTELMFANLIYRANVGRSYLKQLIEKNAFKSEEDLLFAKEMMSNMEGCITFADWCDGWINMKTVEENLDDALNWCKRCYTPKNSL